MSIQISIGTDPEMFLRDKKTKRFVSADGLFPGTKSEPFKLSKGAVQVDGLALEFNIHPAKNVDEFKKNIADTLDEIDQMMLERTPELERVFVPYAEFDVKYFERIADEAKVLGCDPDYDWRGRIKHGPANLQNMPFRTAAGHIHIGWTEDKPVSDPNHFEDARYIAEFFLYEFDHNTYEERRRIQYYGGDGAFRPKSYGVELRSPSNLWVETPESREEMYFKVLSRMNILVARATGV